MKSIRDKGSASEAGCFFGKKRSTRNVPPPAGSGSEEAVRGGVEKEDPWIAPEVFAGGEHTPQSDLYSYGGILFEVRFNVPRSYERFYLPLILVVPRFISPWGGAFRGGAEGWFRG